MPELKNPREITDLEDMTIMEISLVNEPACPEADIILMKSRTSLVDEAIALLRPSNDDLIDAAVMLLKRDVTDEPRDERGRWTHAAVQLLRQASGKVSQQAIDGAKFLHAQAKQAAVHVATKAGNAVRSGVQAVRTTKLTGAYPVEGGGAQFDFEHTFTSGARLSNRVQIRPEHVGNGFTGKQLRNVHTYLASTKGDMRKPFNDEGKSGVFRYDFTKPFSAGSGGSSSSLISRDNRAGPLPMAEEGRNEHGVATYLWQGRQVRGADIKWAPAFTHSQHGFIPETRSDVQTHIVHVNNWMASNRPRSAEVKQAMTRANPHEAGGKGFFTPAGDYIPAADVTAQYKFMRAYEEHRSRQAARQASPASTILSSQLTPERAPRDLYLSANDAAVISDHYDDRLSNEGSTSRFSQHDLRIRRLANRVITGEASGVELTREDVGHLERSMNRISTEDRSPAHNDLQRRLAHHLDFAKMHVAAIVKAKLLHLV